MNASTANRTFWTTVVAAAMLLSGCSAEAGTPRKRLGSLPFPGLLSLYSEANPDDLGMHCSGSPFARLGSEGERERGTLYTRRAGFIDLCHVRESIDWVRYLDSCIRPRLEASPESSDSAMFQFDDCQASFEVTISRPGSWDQLAPDERSRLICETSARASQRLSIVVSTWHEIATWYGYQTIPGISERGSAFTWDDTTAHVVGANIGAIVLREGEVVAREWDHAVTEVLERTLRDLEVLSPSEQDAAAASVRNRWWKGWVAVRRDLDVGLTTSFKVPWLVEDFGTTAAALELPTLENVHGHDASKAVTFRIVPSRGMMRRLMQSSNPPLALEGEAGLLDAVERVRASMREKFGEGFDQP